MRLSDEAREMKWKSVVAAEQVGRRVAVSPDSFMEPRDGLGVDLRQIAAVSVKVGYGPNLSHINALIPTKFVVGRRAENVRAKFSHNDSCNLRIAVFGADGGRINL